MLNCFHVRGIFPFSPFSSYSDTVVVTKHQLYRKDHLTVSDTYMPPTLRVKGTVWGDVCFLFSFFLFFNRKVKTQPETNMTSIWIWRLTVFWCVEDVWMEGWRTWKDLTYTITHTAVTHLIPRKMSPRAEEKQLWGFTHTLSGVSVSLCYLQCVYAGLSRRDNW